ncbi:hypothetical protein V2S66_32900 [Streptomyces sp. V4-01]|uniref:Uncharacterized protein n=1 Tax=Actinacidiphila polyblastidii TaxID=3110430 RepID=A0ABU7PLP3_9ACTN|nr:hypothetical protein [Streptomyces sp. V4-01]
MSSLRPGGPTVRTVLSIALPSDGGNVATPAPLSEYGGILPAPEGTVVRLDIGDARYCTPHNADKIAGALRAAAEIEIVGSDIGGVTGTRSALAAALARARPLATG